MTKKKSVPKTAPAPQSETTPTPVGPVLTPTLLEQLKAADSLEAAVKVLAPTTGRVRVDARYRLNPACADPLPARRGAGLKVLAVAVRLDRPCTVADVQAALPDVKAVRYWVNRLVKSGHLVVEG